MNVKTKHVECAGGIIINKNNEVAIVNQNHDSWSLPKGHIDPGESKLETAKREIRFDNVARSIKKNEDAIYGVNKRMPEVVKKAIKHMPAIKPPM